MIKFTRKQIMTFTAGPFGFLLGMVPFLIGFLTGSGIEFDKARATNEFARALQEKHQLYFWITFSLFLIIVGLFLFHYIYNVKKNKFNPESKTNQFFSYIRIITAICTGYLVYELVIYLLINEIYYHGAFLTIPYLIGLGITLGACILVFTDTKFMAFLYQSVLKQKKQNILYSINKSLNYAKLGKNCIVLILGLIFMIPSIFPMVGITPNPDVQPESGYGSTDRPYSVSKIRIENKLPADIASYVYPDNENSSWYSYIYLPNLAEKSLDVESQIPLAFFLHGYGGSYHMEYDATLRTLASRGVAVIFVQYATDLNVEVILDNLENASTTNSADYYVRYNMTWNGIENSVDALVGNNTLIDQEDLTAILGESYQIDLSRIMIMGHSYGGGMTLFIGPQVIKQGWATKQLIIDLEAPWFASKWTTHDIGLSNLPNYTIVNVVGYEDDATASPCIGMSHFERFYSRDDSDPLNSSQVSYLYIQSDRYGFPRQIATHYLPTDALINTLAHFGYFRRLDAMAGFLTADAYNQTSVAIEALTYFTNGGTHVTWMGDWSDGTPIKPILYSIDPYGKRGGTNIAVLVLDPDHEECQG
ncbi:alpha/beta hydrolase family protein [Candidatus Lokiarchaeum ossiferum]